MLTMPIIENYKVSQYNTLLKSMDVIFRCKNSLAYHISNFNIKVVIKLVIKFHRECFELYCEHFL